MMKRKNVYIIVLTILMALSLCSCSKEDVKEIAVKEEVQQFQNTDFVMDTVLTTTFYGQKDLSSEVRSVLSDLENKELSWRVDGSMAAVINDACGKGQTVTMDDAFAGWTEECLSLAEKSLGAFDPTVGSLTRLWNIEGENPVVPDQKDIDQCLTHIGYDKIKLSGKEITMPEGTTLDLGAVGKGIGCDLVSSYIKEKMEEENIQGAIVAVGGSIVVLGQKPNGEDWKLAIQDPQGDDGVAMGYISMTGENYISTSGDYQKYFIQDGKKYHHILNPKTGYPTENDLTSVTILCDNGLLADGLSTACFVLGEKQGMKLAQDYGAEILMIRQNKEVIMSEGLKDTFTLMSDEYKIVEE